MHRKHCIVCDSTEWDYDVFDGWFDYCRHCHSKVLDVAKVRFTRNSRGRFTVADWLRAVALAREETLGID